MSLTYYKRFRMEIGLSGRDFSVPALSAGYRFVGWDDSLVETHADTKYLSFREEIDSDVFACLGELDGCHRLMHEIRSKQGFLPAATWLIGYQNDMEAELDYCGTIQGIRDTQGLGAVQNLGVTPDHRGRGLGLCLMLQSLAGFQQAGLSRCYLEVTAKNGSAIRLYQRIGFVKVRTVYKPVEVAFS